MRTRVMVAVMAAAVVGVGWYLNREAPVVVSAPPSPPPPAPTGEPPATADCLLAVMVNEGEYEATREADAGDVAWQPWLGPIGIGFVCDRGQGEGRWLSRAQLDAIPLDGGTVESVMLANLERRIGDLPFAPVRDTGVGTNAKDDAYAASLLLLESAWVEMDRSEGSVLVAAPGRGKLFVAPGAPELEKPLRTLAQQAFQQEPDPLYDGVLARRDGGWELLP